MKKIENEKLLSKLAWNYASTNGLEYDDLFQEACLAYLEALRTHDESRGKISTHIWTSVSNRLKSYIDAQKRGNADLFSQGKCCFEEYNTPVAYNNFWWHGLTKDAIIVAEVIFESSDEFVKLNQRTLYSILIKTMRSFGWNTRRIKKCFSVLRNEFSFAKN